MADLRSRFIEDYAGGLLNVSRQELSTVGEVLSQDGLPSEGTIFIEDGTGVKSGLKVGVSLAECVDPTTETGIVNVRFADRTYAKIRDLKIFSTAIASAQAALSEATSTSVSNLETAFELLEADLTSLTKNIQDIVENQQKFIEAFTDDQGSETGSLASRLDVQESDIENLTNRVNIQFTRLTNVENVIRDLGALVARTTKIDPVDTTLNRVYYSGFVYGENGIYQGVQTSFSNEMEVGDVFLVEGTDSNNKSGEFQIRVVGFDTTDPQTKIFVSPTNVTVSPELIISAANYNSTTQKITVDTTTNHGLIKGQGIALAGISTANYNGTYIIDSIVDSNTFIVNPGDVPPASGGAALTSTPRVYVGKRFKYERVSEVSNQLNKLIALLKDLKVIA